MKNKILRIIISMILFLISFIFEFNSSYINILLYIISYLIVGYGVLLEALSNIFHGEVFDENFLMSIATIGACFIGEFHEAVAVMLFYQIGECFQDFATDRSRKSVISLMDIRPDYANLCVDNEVKKLNPSDVKVGDIICVYPGEKVPLDGIIIEGVSSFDTKALTGESLYKDLSVNSEVYAGYINLNGVVKVKVKSVYGESTVSKILNLVENSSKLQASSEMFIRRFAKIYTPVVVFISVGISLLGPLVLNQNFGIWIYRGLSFLVVSCPCALVISVPLSFFAGIGVASRNGILIKGANYLERLSKSKIFVFDKTGTLTIGDFAVDEICPVGISLDEFIMYISYAESISLHPLAKVVKKLYKNDFDDSFISSSLEIAGRGVSVNVCGHDVLVGNKYLLKENGVVFNDLTNDSVCLYMAIDGIYRGYITFKDLLKEDAVSVVNMLRCECANKVYMLTGDREEVAKSVAEELSLDGAFFELLPQDKVRVFNQIVRENILDDGIVFVGDGINDAPVLSLAHIGIAMGLIGSDSAIESADIVIMNDRLSSILSAINILKNTVKIVKENIIFAIVVKVLILILSLFGISTMWEAVFADVGVSVVAILNSIRVFRMKF